jgi:hypothetical protein
VFIHIVHDSVTDIIRCISCVNEGHEQAGRHHQAPDEGEPPPAAVSRQAFPVDTLSPLLNFHSPLYPVLQWQPREGSTTNLTGVSTNSNRRTRLWYCRDNRELVNEEGELVEDAEKEVSSSEEETEQPAAVE